MPAAADRTAEWHALLDLSLLWARRSYERTGAYATQALELARAIGDPRQRFDEDKLFEPAGP